MRVLAGYWERRYILTAGFVFLFAVIGAIILFTSHAATPFASVEPESGTTNGVTTTQDSKASSGSYVQFGSASTGGGTPHILVLVMENNSYSDIIGNSGAPYINSLATSYKSLTKMYALAHDSLPNYLGLITGQSYGSQYGSAGNDDCSPGSNCLIVNSVTTLADQLDTAKIPWEAFMEGMPSTCDKSDGPSGSYVARHDPFVYKPNLVTSDCSKIVGVSQNAPPDTMTTALNAATPPDFVWYSPTINNDAGGDSSAATVSNGDAYLKKEIPAIQATSWYTNGGTIVLTFDESDESDTADGVDGAAGGHIPTIVISAATAGKGSYATRMDTYGLLRSIENAYSLSCLGSACNSAAGSVTL